LDFQTESPPASEVLAARLIVEAMEILDPAVDALYDDEDED
jgi:hypothetical protein